MKRLLLLLSVLAVSFDTCAQGTVFFSTHSYGIIDAKVYDANGVPLAGSTWLAQLFGASGLDAPFESLQGGTPVTTFRTGEAAGYVDSTTVEFSNIPIDTFGYTVQMRVWDNSSGCYPTWASVEQAWVRRSVPATVSERLSFPGIIGGGVAISPPLTGLQSFGITYIPEPSASALGGFCMTAFLIFRRCRR